MNAKEFAYYKMTQLKKQMDILVEEFNDLNKTYSQILECFEEEDD